MIPMAKKNLFNLSERLILPMTNWGDFLFSHSNLNLINKGDREMSESDTIVTHVVLRISR
jgi:hypothetical protein